MLTARLEDKIVNALDVNDRKALYICPSCGDPVTLAKGNIKIHHFKHQAHTACIRTGETMEHLKTKANIYNKLRDNPDIEIVEAECSRFEGIRPDVAFKHKMFKQWVGVEIQQSAISLDDIAERCLRYQNSGVAIMWVLPEIMYSKIIENESGEFRLTQWQKHIRTLHEGLFVFSGEFLVFLTVRNVIRTRELYNSNTCEYYGEKDEVLQNTFYCDAVTRVFFENLTCKEKSYWRDGATRVTVYNPLTLQDETLMFDYYGLLKITEENSSSITEYLNGLTLQATRRKDKTP